MIHAYIDESGQRGHSDKASPHFLLGGYVVRNHNNDEVGKLLAKLRADLAKEPGSYLTWKNIRSHGQRLHIASEIAKSEWLKQINVVACKNHLSPGSMNQDQIYLYQLRYYLERLSWLARDYNDVASYTIAHIKGFKLEYLREYESRLRSSKTTIAWMHLDPKGGSIDQPQRNEYLQLADLSISATATAFNPDKFGYTEPRYLQTMWPRLWDLNGRRVTTYGLKMHPWTPEVSKEYPWIKEK